MKPLLLHGVTVLLALMVPAAPRAAAELPKQYRDMVEKGLRWLVRQQHKDGHWAGGPKDDPVALTALAGAALMMEGNTTREGRYADSVRRAVDWILENGRGPAPRDGLLAGPKADAAHRPLLPHARALSFLTQVYEGEEEPGWRRPREEVLKAGVAALLKAQSPRGGWFPTHPPRKGDREDPVVTAAALRALRGGRNAGLPVPKAAIQKAVAYLEGTVARANEADPTAAAAALAASFGPPDLAWGNHPVSLDSPLAKRWLKFCRQTVPLRPVGKQGVPEELHYHLAPVIFYLWE